MEKNTGRHTLVILTFSCYVLPHIETSKLICIANQYTGLYMRGNINMKKVKMLVCNCCFRLQFMEL